MVTTSPNEVGSNVQLVNGDEVGCVECLLVYNIHL